MLEKVAEAMINYLALTLEMLALVSFCDHIWRSLEIEGSVAASAGTEIFRPPEGCRQHPRTQVISAKQKISSLLLI